MTSTNRELIALVHELNNPRPAAENFTDQTGPDDFEYHEDAHNEALMLWEAEFEALWDWIERFPEIVDINALTMSALRRTTNAARSAEEKQAQAMAVAREIVGLSERAIAAACETTNKTVTRRIANNPESMRLVEEFQRKHEEPQPSGMGEE